MYDYKFIEEKWNRIWTNNKTFKVLRDRLKPPFYALVGYNSPSIDSFIKMDANARYQRMCGANVLFPSLRENMNIIHGIGMDYQKVISKDFLYKSQNQLLDYLVNKGVIYTEVMDNITYYKAEINDFYETINKMSLPEATKEVKKEFFQLHEGYNLFLEVVDKESIIRLFLEELENLYLSTFIVLPYNHDLAFSITNEEELEDLELFIQNPNEEELIFTGSYVVNPITEQAMPLFVGSVEKILLGTPAIDSKALAYATKYDIEVLSMDYFDDFSLHLRNQAKDTLEKMNMLEPATLKNTTELTIATKETDHLIFEECFNSVYFLLAPIASNIDLDINVIDYKDEINKWLPIDCFIFQDGYELLSSLLIHHLFHKADFIHNNIFAKKIIYHNPKIVHNHDNSDLCRLMVFSNISSDVGMNILNNIWHLYSKQLLDSFSMLDGSYMQLKKDCKQAYDKRDYNMVMAYVSRFMTLVNEKKGLSYEQAFGLLKILSPLVPYICEEIYQAVFNNLDSIAYEDWPL